MLGLHIQWPHPAGAQALMLKARCCCLLCHPPASGNSLLGLSALIPILPCINKQVGGLVLAYSLETRSRERCSSLCEEVQRPSLTSIKLITLSNMVMELRGTCRLLSEDEDIIFQNPDSDTSHRSGTLRPSRSDGLPRHVTAKGKI